VRREFRLAILAVILGALSGLVAPSSSARADTVFVDVFVPQGGNGYLTCGWHGSANACGSGTSNAMDWDSSIDADIWWRSWVILSSSSTPAAAVDARPVDGSGTCTAVRVDTYDNNALLQGSVTYKHTDRKTSNFNVLGKDVGAWDTHTVGKSIDPDDELSGCSITGANVHMNSSYGSHNHSAPQYYPTDSQCQQGGTETYCGTLGSRHTYHYHMYAKDWSY